MDFIAIAYHGQQAIKDKYIARVKAHREADELIRGTGWDGHKGCAVGCTLEKYDHVAYETELGIPRSIAHLEDGIFEALPQDIAMGWPERFLTAIEPGADLSLVMSNWFVWMLTDPVDGVIKFAKSERIRVAIQSVSSLYQRKANGEDVADSEFAAASAAYAADAAAYAATDYAAAYAADAAAYAATDYAAAYAAYAAAHAAAYAADAAADAAHAAAYAADAAADAAHAAADAAYAAADAATDYAYADAAARYIVRQKQADKLIELLVVAPKATVSGVLNVAPVNVTK